MRRSLEMVPESMDEIARRTELSGLDFNIMDRLFVQV